LKGVCGVVCYLDNSRLFKISSNIGPLATNNTAEYMSLIYGIYILSLLNVKAKIVFIGDSQLVVKQMTKEFKITKSNIFVLNEIVIYFLFTNFVIISCLSIFWNLQIKNFYFILIIGEFTVDKYWKLWFCACFERIKCRSRCFGESS